MRQEEAKQKVGETLGPKAVENLEQKQEQMRGKGQNVLDTKVVTEESFAKVIELTRNDDDFKIIRYFTTNEEWNASIDLHERNGPVDFITKLFDELDSNQF